MDTKSGGATSVPEGVAFNATNNEIYVALKNSSSVAVTDATTNAVITVISTAAGDAPVALAYDSADNMVYVANADPTCSPCVNSTCTIPVIDGTTNTLLGSIPMGSGPANVAFDNSTDEIYVSSADNGTVSVIYGTSLVS
jgi:YVTN family beta-propeller protein